jgi:amidohydrolase
VTDPGAAAVDDVKDAVRAAVEARASDLVACSQAIWAHPELGYEERFAANSLCDLLDDGGFEVERAAYGIDTAFAGRAGDGDGPHVVLCCEYDALPKIGHGCGHNIIGTVGAGAGLSLLDHVDRLGGRLTVLGCPAEELGGGGKIRLLERGAFDGADVAMMVHPSVGDVEWAPHIANSRIRCEMHGTAAHAAAAPWRGVNALDALVLGYMGVAAIRQHLKPGEKVHGIITDGGEAENIVPDHAAAMFQVRAPNQLELGPVQQRILACFDGAATQTGARFEWEEIARYAELLWNGTLAGAYKSNGERVGRPSAIPPKQIPLALAGSTDMGNVSHALPALHAMIRIADLHVAGHSIEFAEAARADVGDAAVIDGAAILAMTAVDVWADPELVGRARIEHVSEAERATRPSRY